MAQPETRAWWSDVQHLRDSIERKREDEARRGLRLDARSAARAVADREAEEERNAYDVALPDDLDWVTRPRRRFERLTPERRGRFARGERDGGDDRQASTRGGEPREAAPTGHTAVPPAAEPLRVPSRRRTVEITGRPLGAPSLPRLVQIDRRRPARRPVERIGPRPDRLALWAVVLGFFLILVAVTSTSHAATGPQGARAAGAHTAHSQVVRAHTTTLRATPPAR
jgi:hypothetical protein